jgi:hypothetical protein
VEVTRTHTHSAVIPINDVTESLIATAWCMRRVGGIAQPQGLQKHSFMYCIYFHRRNHYKMISDTSKKEDLHKRKRERRKALSIQFLFHFMLYIVY